MPKIDYNTLEMFQSRYLSFLATYSKGITDNYLKGAVGYKAGLTQFGVSNACQFCANGCLNGGASL
jgi:hypothetical protein